jgi:hypothetical protein
MAGNLQSLSLFNLLQAFYVFKHKPHERLSVWQFWKRLKAAQLAFHPGRSSRGVFPMTFMPGLR